MDKDWRDWVASVFIMAVVATLIYAGGGYVAEWVNPRLKAPLKQQRAIHPDLYVYHRKSYVSSAASAEKLIGKPLWVKEGYRWLYGPGEKTFEPLEKIVATAVRQEGEDTLIEFEKGERLYATKISAGNFFYVDEIFLIEDPRELYAHWTAQDWKKIEAHQVELGMTEYQAAFALGAGRLGRYSPGGALRIVEYALRQSAGLPALRLTFKDGLVTNIERIAADEQGPP